MLSIFHLNFSLNLVSGGNDEAREGHWVWPSDGQPFYDREQGVIPGQHSNWAKPEDNPAPANDAKLNCMVMVKEGTYEGMWREGSCKMKLILCEAVVVEGKALHLDSLSFLDA